MNFLSGAISAAKGAYEYGASTVSTVSSTVTSQVAANLKKPADGEVGAAGGKKSVDAKEEHEEGKKEEKEAEPSFGQLEFKLDYNFEKGTMAITVIQGKDLPAMDLGGTSDPYVRVYIMPEKKKKFDTKVHKKTLNPVFNETFQFQKLPFNEMSSKTLIFAVFDHDAVGSDDQIGEVQIPLASIDLAADNIQMWRDVKEPPKNVLGDICLSLRYAPTKKPAQLTCMVIECKNLKKMDLGGSSDPYVKIIQMQNGKRVKKFKTPVKMCDLNPYYNQSFKLEVDPITIAKLELHVFVMDYDRVGSNDAIGWLKFGMNAEGTAGQHWRSVINNPKRSMAQWHSLMPVEEDDKK